MVICPSFCLGFINVSFVRCMGKPCTIQAHPPRETHGQCVGTFCKSSAHYATLKTGVKFQISNQLNFLNCPCNRLVWRWHTRKTVPATCPRNTPRNTPPQHAPSTCPQHAPTTCPRNLSPQTAPATCPHNLSPQRAPAMCPHVPPNMPAL